MSANSTLRRSTWAALTVLIWLLAPATLPAGDVEDFNQLQKQFMQQLYAGKHRDADQTASRLRQLAEGPLSQEPKAMLIAVNAQGLVRLMDGRFADAEPLLKWVITAGRQSFGPDSSEVAVATSGLGDLYVRLGRFAEAEPFYQRALTIQQKLNGPQHQAVAMQLHNLGLLYLHQGRHAEAELMLKRAMAIWEQTVGPDHHDLASCLENLAGVYMGLGRYTEAEPLLKRALTMRGRLHAADTPAAAATLNALGMLYFNQGRYAEAEPFYRQALAIREKTLAPDHPDLGATLGNLALLCDKQGRYAEAEALFKRVLPILEKSLGPDHPDVAATLCNLGHLYTMTGRWVEAETLFKRALAIREKKLPPDHPDMAATLHNLASLYQTQGRNAEAEPLFKQALAIWEKTLGPRHHYVGTNYNNLAQLYVAEGRYDEAERLMKKALALFEKVNGPEHENVAMVKNNLGMMYFLSACYEEAEPMLKQAAAIWEAALGPEHPNALTARGNLAHLYSAMRRYDEAEPLFLRTQETMEKVLGPDHPTVAGNLAGTAKMYFWQEKYDKAELLVDRAILISERVGAAPGDRCFLYLLRARIEWQDGRRGEAVADLRQAMQLAEQQRASASGSEQERALMFSGFGDIFETMVAWQAELGDAGEALAAIERSRARSLLDELALVGADLSVGRSTIEREQIRKHEFDLQQKIAGLQKQLELLEAGAAKLSKDEYARQKRDLEAAVNKARANLYEYYRDQRSSNPVYRNLLSTGGGPPRISQLRRQLVGPDGLLLVYLLGQDGGYVVVVGPRTAQVEKLAVDAVAAEALGVEAGPLTAARLSAALVNQKGDGVLQQLRKPGLGVRTTDKLAALWRTLVPESQRKSLTDGSVKRLAVAPDAQLALLPFETLVVETGKQPRYLLDAGPPIEYGPSASVLCNLAERRPVSQPTGHEPVLTVGNPTYSPPDAPAAPSMPGLVGQLAARSRYSALGGKLTPLPFTDQESGWVADGFARSGIQSARLAGAAATEANVRRQVPGRRIVHLACHGLTDRAYGNFYGALALTPGSGANPADDGFLTLAEIYELDLHGAELTILSACETNFGPEQRGEGVWALSRGFLVAGSRRVVASDWLVDDEEAASLVSRFCGSVARAEKEGRPVDYAAALHEAKCWVRQQEKWQSPYYWGSLVLVGPN